MKKCSGCGRLLEETCFYKSGKYLRAKCTECYKIDDKRYRMFEGRARIRELGYCAKSLDDKTLEQRIERHRLIFSAYERELTMRRISKQK